MPSQRTYVNTVGPDSQPFSSLILRRSNAGSRFEKETEQNVYDMSTKENQYYLQTRAQLGKRNTTVPHFYKCNSEHTSCHSVSSTIQHISTRTHNYHGWPARPSPLRGRQRCTEKPLQACKSRWGVTRWQDLFRRLGPRHSRHQTANSKRLSPSGVTEADLLGRVPACTCNCQSFSMQTQVQNCCSLPAGKRCRLLDVHGKLSRQVKRNVLRNSSSIALG